MNYEMFRGSENSILPVFIDRINEINSNTIITMNNNNFYYIVRIKINV